MPGLRILLIFGAIVAVVLLVRRLYSAAPRQEVKSSQQRDTDKVVACEQCGVHVPEAELVDKGGKRLCRQCARE